MTPNIDTVTGELVPTETRNLFRTDDPTEVLAAAKTVAEALKGALKTGGMVIRIRDSEHVRIEGWQTLGSMLGVTPYVVWSRPIEGGWEARAEARAQDGRPVGAGEAMCSRGEKTWKGRDDYAIRSMAQTRAMSKALSGPLRFIITLAGYSGTPAEELDEAYGPAATDQERRGLERAALALRADADVPQLLGRLERDGGGYLPRVVARGIMLVAAHRPAPTTDAPTHSEGETGTEGSPHDTPTPDGPGSPREGEEAATPAT
jgi:hypothetical protein